MRLAVVHNLKPGGAHRRLAGQVAALDAEVVEFTTASATPVTPRPYVVPLTQLAAGRAPLVRPPLRFVDLHRLAATWRTIGELAERSGADAIYANPDSVLRGAMPLGPRSIPVIRYCDEPRRIDYEPGVRHTLNPRTRALYTGLRRLERHLDRTAMTEAGVLATNSRYTAAAIETAYGRPATVLPCGVPDRMTPAPGRRPEHLLSVGTLIPGKGHDLVIEAAGLAGLDLPVVIVAHRHAPDEEDRLREIARRHGVELWVETGLSDEQLVERYRAAYATLYLARAEPLGLVSLEAQACGSPVIVAGEGGLPETVRPGRTGLVVERTGAAAADALRSLAGRRDEMAVAAAAGASGWSESAGALLALVADRTPVGASR